MKKIGIIGAMEMEVETLKEQLSDPVKETVARMEFCEGTLKGVPVVVVRSGVGKVNAAMCTQILADRFGVDAVINTGRDAVRLRAGRSAAAWHYGVSGR